MLEAPVSLLQGFLPYLFGFIVHYWAKLSRSRLTLGNLCELKYSIFQLSLFMLSKYQKKKPENLEKSFFINCWTVLFSILDAGGQWWWMVEWYNSLLPVTLEPYWPDRLTDSGQHNHINYIINLSPLLVIWTQFAVVEITFLDWEKKQKIFCIPAGK